MRRLALALAFVLTAVTSASAQIPSLFNSGVDAAGNPLPLGAFDPHYTASSFSTVGTPGSLIGQAQVINNGYQTFSRYAQNSTSRWIWANATGNFDGLHFNTLLRTTFDLTGYDLSTVSITVSMAADNAISGVYLNGSTLGQSYVGFSGFYSYTIASGFTSSVNILDYYAQDSGAPAGFNVHYSSRASLLPVTTTPEPASLVLFGTGLIGLIGVARRRRSIA